VPEWLGGLFSYLVFKCLIVIGRCPVNINILALKIGVLQLSPKEQTGYFLENGCSNLITFRKIMLKILRNGIL
jgi:hypothetical protein